MEMLSKEHWSLFKANQASLMKERSILLSCGYYSGFGAQAKKVDLTPIITKACVNADYMFKAFNDAKRNGVTGQKVRIFF